MAVTIESARQALAAMAGLPVSDLSLPAALDRVVQTADGLFKVAATGLMLIDDEQDLRNVAVSDPRMELLERAHLAAEEGPALEALAEGTFVYTGAIGDDSRWPRFREVALRLGLNAVLAAPIPNQTGSAGVLAMLSDARHPWTDAEAEAAVAFAELISVLIVKALQASARERLTAQLQHALGTRVLVEQAKGMLMERHGISAQQAYERLRRRARGERRRVADVAEEIIAGRTSPTSGS
ncbi:MAG TPA: GAF and ANTAR domain-containing protein [Actinomycetes bacterium]|nr:GAF and ANTAR domain-containing protein [Actinomycetes bacterium]